MERDDAPLVVVLGTTEAGLLRLARIALEEAGIEYAVRNAGLADQIMGRRSSMSIGETDPPLQVLVRAEDASRARDALRDIETPGIPLDDAGPAPASQPAPATWGVGTVDLFDKDSGQRVGRISETQLQELASRLERESRDDDDYFIDGPTLSMLREQGVDAGVIELLRDALQGREGMEVRWARRA